MASLEFRVEPLPPRLPPRRTETTAPAEDRPTSGKPKAASAGWKKISGSSNAAGSNFRRMRTLPSFCFPTGSVNSRPQPAAAPLTLEELAGSTSRSTRTARWRRTRSKPSRCTFGISAETLGDGFPIASAEAGRSSRPPDDGRSRRASANDGSAPSRSARRWAASGPSGTGPCVPSCSTGPFPNRGLVYPKTDEKPPFQTWEEIERQIARGGLSAAEQKDLWDCLFLTLPRSRNFSSTSRSSRSNRSSTRCSASPPTPGRGEAK